MNYVTNESGDIKVQDANGNIKWLPKIIAENKFIMEGKGLTISPAPVKFEATKEPVKAVEEPIEVIDSGTHFPAPENEEEKQIVADAAPAKRGRKPNK